MVEWPKIDAFLRSKGVRIGAPTVGQTTGGNHVKTSEHYLGRARDYGNADSDVSAIVNALKVFAVGSNYIVDELFNSTTGCFYDHGRRFSPDGALRSGHFNHVHVGIRYGANFPISEAEAMASFPNAIDACLAPNGGAWVMGTDGGVGTFGGAPFLGSYHDLKPEQRQGIRHFLSIVPTEKGYALLADDGASYFFPL